MNGISGAELLAFADEVVGAPTPRPAALRRAVSASYYAVFHEVIQAALRRSLGADPSHDADRHVVARWYRHSDLRIVSRWVVAQAHGRTAPGTVAGLLESPPADLVALAVLVEALQNGRVDADYARSATISVDVARQAVLEAHAALAHLSRLAGDRIADNYLTLLLGGPRLPVR